MDIRRQFWYDNLQLHRPEGGRGVDITNQKVTVRPATGRDLEALNDFQRKAADRERALEPVAVQHVCDFKDILAKRDTSLVLIAEGAGMPIGFGVCRIRENGEASYGHIEWLYVKEEWQPKGVRNKVLKDLIEWSHGQGATEVRLSVFAADEESLMLYVKEGFRPFSYEMVADARSMPWLGRTKEDDLD